MGVNICRHGPHPKRLRFITWKWSHNKWVLRNIHDKPNDLLASITIKRSLDRERFMDPGTLRTQSAGYLLLPGDKGGGLLARPLPSRRAQAPAWHFPGCQAARAQTRAVPGPGPCVRWSPGRRGAGGAVPIMRPGTIPGPQARPRLGALGAAQVPGSGLHTVPRQLSRALCRPPGRAVLPSAAPPLGRAGGDRRPCKY